MPLAEPSCLSADQRALDRSPPKSVADGIERRLEVLLFRMGLRGIAAKEIRLKDRIGLPARETKAHQSHRLNDPGPGFVKRPAGANDRQVA